MKNELSKVKSTNYQNLYEELLKKVELLIRMVTRILLKLFPEEECDILRSKTLPKLPMNTKNELEELEEFLEDPEQFADMVRNISYKLKASDMNDLVLSFVFICFADRTHLQFPAETSGG